MKITARNRIVLSAERVAQHQRGVRASVGAGQTGGRGAGTPVPVVQHEQLVLHLLTTVPGDKVT